MAFSNENDEKRKILSLNDLIGPFILLIAGLIVSLLVFLFERLYNHMKLITKNTSPTILGIENSEIALLQDEKDVRMEAKDQLTADNFQEGFDATSNFDYKIEETCIRK